MLSCSGSRGLKSSFSYAMYSELYGFTAEPFRLTPDQRFYYDSEVHRRAMAYLRYGLEQAEGFIVITGDIGTGKTMLVRNLFGELEDGKIMAAQLVSTRLQAEDLLRMVCASFGLAHEGMNKATMLHNLEVICRTRYAQGQRILLVVDEAQNLSAGSLEELRLLANYQSEGRALFQAFLLGQNQLRRTLQTANLAQLRQRIIASYHLDPLSKEETRAYIEHRLRLVGWGNDPALEEAVFRGIFEATGGVPRLINTLCNRLLLYGCIEEKHGLAEADLGVVLKDMHQGVEAEARHDAATVGEEEVTLAEREWQDELDVKAGTTPERPNGQAEGHSAALNAEGESGTPLLSLQQRVAKLEADVSRLNKVLAHERRLLRKAILLQLDVDAGDELQ